MCFFYRFIILPFGEIFNTFSVIFVLFLQLLPLFDILDDMEVN